MSPADFALLGIEAATIVAVWSWGFGSVLTMWMLGYVVGVAVRMIRAV